MDDLERIKEIDKIVIDAIFKKSSRSPRLPLAVYATINAPKGEAVVVMHPESLKDWSMLCGIPYKNRYPRNLR